MPFGYFSLFEGDGWMAIFGDRASFVPVLGVWKVIAVTVEIERGIHL